VPKWFGSRRGPLAVGDPGPDRRRRRAWSSRTHPAARSRATADDIPATEPAEIGPPPAGAAGGSVGAAGGRELADGWCDGPLPRVVDVADGAIVGTDGAAGGREPTPDGRRDGASDGDAEG